MVSFLWAKIKPHTSLDIKTLHIMPISIPNFSDDKFHLGQFHLLNANVNSNPQEEEGFVKMQVLIQ